MYSIHSYAIIHFAFSSDQLVVIVIVAIAVAAVVVILLQSIFRMSQSLFATHFDIAADAAAASVPAVFDASSTSTSYVLDSWMEINMDTKSLAIYKHTPSKCRAVCMQDVYATVYEFKMYIQSGQSLPGWRPYSH